MRYPHDSDLRWYLDGSYEAALGMKSAHPSLVARLEGSTGNAATDDTRIQDDLVNASLRGRAIKEVLERCSHRTQHVLAAWARPDKRVDYWGELTHVLPLCPEYDAEKHGKVDGSIALRMGLGNPKEDQKAVALFLRRTAEATIAVAMREYGDGVELAKAERPKLFHDAQEARDRLGQGNTDGARGAA